MDKTRMDSCTLILLHKPIALTHDSTALGYFVFDFRDFLTNIAKFTGRHLYEAWQLFYYRVALPDIIKLPLIVENVTYGTGSIITLDSVSGDRHEIDIYSFMFGSDFV